jgi:hypothetical protein
VSHSTPWQVLTALATCLLILPAHADDAPYDRPPINYSSAELSDPVATLQHKLDAGQLKLTYDAKTGYLPALLRALNIPVSSQVLVFSKTSFQRNLISPETPRALYFNDDVYVGYVQGGDVIEITATDPNKGPIFYTLRQKTRGLPTFARQTDACLQCHASSMTQDLPGHLVRSVYPDADGQPILSAGSFRTNPASPLKQRWGGWYVTGRTGSQVHMGNVFSRKKDDAESTDFTSGTNALSLADRLDTTPYLSPHSDVVALMLMEHQIQVHNLITRANILTRLALHDAVELNKALNRPADYRSESTTSRIKNAVEPLLKAMLFSEETPLTDKVEGTSTFAADFAKAAPRDPKGRSLRDLDLQSRLFRHPLSYLIYTPAFDTLPAAAKDQFYTRLDEVLSGKDTTKDFAHLTPADRTAVRDILIATKTDLPKPFRP